MANRTSDTSETHAQRFAVSMGESSLLALVLKTVGVIGLPGTLLVYVIWFGTSQFEAFNARLDRMHDEAVMMRQNLALHATDTAWQTRQMERIERVLVASCLNTATSQSQRDRCLGDP